MRLIEELKVKPNARMGEIEGGYRYTAVIVNEDLYIVVLISTSCSSYF